MHRYVRAALATILLLSCSACTRSSGFDYSHDSAAVVLVKDGRDSALVIVDLKSFRVVRRVKLRSQAFSMDADPDTRVVVTAQCGGLDQETDDACGKYRLGDRKVRYLDLAVPNPLDVAVAQDTAYLVHGFVREGGLCTSVVDLRRGRVAAHGSVPLEAQRPERVGSSVVLPVPAMPAEGGAPSTQGRLCVMRGSEVTTLVGGLPMSTCTLLASVDTSRVIVAGLEAGPDGARKGSRSIAAFEPGSDTRVEIRKAPWLTKGPESAGCLCADGIAIADSSATDPEDTGHDVVFLDPDTLQPVLRRTLDGMPASVAAWEDKTLVVDGETGELLLYEKGETQPSRRLKVCAEPNLVADMVVFPAAARGGDSVDSPR